MTNLQSQPTSVFPSSDSVRTEASRLLRHMQFSANRGAVAKGEHVTILVDPRWSEDAATIQVLVTCYVVLPLTIAWHQLAIAARSQDGKLTTLPVAFDERGQALIESLLPSRYNIVPYERTGRAIALEPKGIPTQALLGLGAGKMAADKLRVPARNEPIQWTSPDGRLLGTVIPTAKGVEVAFETRAAELAGTRIQFLLVAQEPKVPPLAAEVTLQPVADQPEIWEGVWQGIVPREEVYELLFSLDSQDDNL